MQTHPNMYRLLVRDASDTPGALAYSSYKQHEAQVFAEIETRTGMPPSPDDVRKFERSASMPTALDMYRRTARDILKAFLDQALLVEQQNLRSEFPHSVIGRQLSQLQAQLDARKSLSGWFRDMSAQLVVTLMTLMVIASLV